MFTGRGARTLFFEDLRLIVRGANQIISMAWDPLIGRSIRGGWKIIQPSKCDKLDMGLLFCNDTIKGLTMRFLKYQMLVRLWVFHSRYLVSCVYIFGARELLTELGSIWWRPQCFCTKLFVGRARSLDVSVRTSEHTDHTLAYRGDSSALSTWKKKAFQELKEMDSHGDEPFGNVI